MLLAFIGNLCGPDILVIGLLTLLIFGRSLPAVGTDVARTVRDFQGRSKPDWDAVFFAAIVALLVVYLIALVAMR